ncbi:hypothetical protein MUY27_02965 [Mucilaginibacter sp. RS28]|uniref:Holin n=1 Tax=Mucilaginibacter straminoryzae TaxID=2932774 RepID=A0A9X2BAC8_9SPHI|nr:hypothetical protein [Mucilaginibacter straminoryzae]MCJ8208652.1 hypothetical protein [Mucilaginibacter straminoryzae]
MKTLSTLWQRLKSETPPFFKRAQVFGASLVAFGTTLTQIAGIPDKVPTILISVGTAITAIAQFAVKQTDSSREASNG